MPYFDFLNKDDEQQKGQGGGLSPTPALSPGLSGGFGFQGPIAPQGGPAPASPPAKTGVDTANIPNDASGSSFVNYGQYYAANKGVAEQRANEIANKVENAGQVSEGGMNNLYNQFQGEVRNGTTSSYTPMTINPGTGQIAATATANNTIRTGDTPGTEGRSSNARGRIPVNSPGSEGSAASTAAVAQKPTPGGGADLGLSRDELDKRANQQYSGPQSFSAMPGYDALTGQVQTAQGQANALQSKDGISGYLSQQFGGTPGSGENELDSLLVNTAGRQRFNQIGQQFKGLGDEMDQYGRQGQEQVNQAKSDSGIVADKYKSLVGQFDDAEKGRADKNAADAELAGKKAGKQKFDEYNKWRHESVVRDITNHLDPTWYAKQLGLTGGKSINETATDGWEKTANQNGMERDSNQVRMWDMPGPVQDAWPAVYEDLLPEELASLEQMPQKDQIVFILNRAKQLRGKAK